MWVHSTVEGTLSFAPFFWPEYRECMSYIIRMERKDHQLIDIFSNDQFKTFKEEQI